MLTRNRSPKPARAPDRTSIRPQEHQKAGQYSPNHVDVSSEAPMQKHRELSGPAEVGSARGEGDINFVDRG